MPLYHQHLESLRDAFPAPVSDPVHDGYVVFSLLRTLDRVDALKSQAPILGVPREPDYAAAARASLANEPQSLEEVIPQLVDALNGMLIVSHPRSQVNVVAPPSIASVIGTILPGMYNPNLCSDESGRGCSEAEVRVASIAAQLVGYDPQTSGGVFTFGGTGTLLYGLKIGLEKALPRHVQPGSRQNPPSFSAPTAATTPAAPSPPGSASVKTPSSAFPRKRDNSIDIAALEAAAREQLDQGKAIAAIVATMGTTDAFGIDDLAGIYALRQRLVDDYQLPYSPTFMPTPSSAGPGRSSATIVFTKTRSAFAAAPSALSPPPSRAFAISIWPIPSASISTKRASLPISRRSCCSATAPTLASLPASAKQCPISITRANTIPACSRSKPPAAPPASWRRWPTCCSSAKTASARSSATPSKWPRCFAS